jgi:N-acetylmuramic acid 6-phosphate etherase
VKRRAAPRPGGRWARLLTEARNPRSRRLDRMSTQRAVALLLDEDRRALTATLRQRGPIARAARAVARSLARGGRVVLAGAGTSGRLGVIEAAECPPTFGIDPDRVRAVIAGGPGAVFRSVEGAEDREGGGRRAGRGLGDGDVLIAISASALTPFARGALAAARERRARTVLITCAPQRGLSRLADVVVAIRTGPEVLTGSTRLKAGSATKAALNAITTAAMVQLGKVFENLMVDLKPSSAKLRDRALRNVATIARVSRTEAQALLDAAGGEAKTAIVMGRLRLGAAAARRRLEAARGHVARALASLSSTPHPVPSPRRGRGTRPAKRRPDS